ncbi:hypothetical protein EXS70_01565 [Candidatus Peribacteria bacterium]|nr:hypothetical protein [Candidatus Peribacteria bacterium]
MSLLIDDTTSHVTDPTTDKEPLPKQKTPKVPEKNTVGAASDAALNTLNTMREKRRAAKRAGQKQ